MNNELSAHLNINAATASPGMAKNIENVLLRNKAAVYRTIAVQLWAERGSVMSLLEKSAQAKAAIETLMATLTTTHGQLEPLKQVCEESGEAHDEMTATLKVMLGHEWEAFQDDAAKR